MMNTELPITGGCACGRIRFTCTQLPLLMFQCHCKDCQRAVGGLFAPNVWFASNHIQFETEPESYVVKSEAGNTVHHEFCNQCGSPVGMRVEERAVARGIRASTLADSAWLKPDANIFMKNSYPWEALDPDLPSYNEDPPIEFIQMLASRLST